MRNDQILDKDQFYMRQALKESQKAYIRDEVPIGAVIVKDDKIIAKAYNNKEGTGLVTNHAEILVIQKANKKVGDWRLEDCTMYVTMEPCPMCMGAIIQSRIKKIYIGAMDKKTGAVGSVLNLTDYKFNHQVEVKYGLLEEECSQIVKDFFRDLRKKNK